MTTDHKGYEVKTRLDWQDKVILTGCIAAAVALVLLLGVAA